MKARNSTVHTMAPMLQIAPGDGEWEILEANVEIVFAGWNLNGIREIYNPAKIRINAAFGSKPMSVEEVREWRNCLEVALGLATDTDTVWPSIPQNVIDEWLTVKDSL